MSHRRGRALLAAAAIAALAGLGGCADADRIGYLALVGEAPGDKPLYTGFTASARLGRARPGIPDGTYRPPPIPDQASGTLADAARAARQGLSDRAGDFELRARYLALDADEFVSATVALRPTVGRPLPPNSEANRARIAAARRALARTQADVLSLHGIVQRTDQAKAQATRVLAAVDAADAAAKPLAAPLRTGVGNIDKMQKDGEAVVGRFVEWMADQRTALDALESEIVSGAAPGPTIFQRETLFQ
ncbi:MAG: hypothetical protein KIT16_11150 [Rhodospirillaceae bacterium]|nr:hypothetical protein [Rhodospirillaceae bacterium]